MIQRGSDTSLTNFWSLLLYIQSLLHYIENAQENKKNTFVSYNIAEDSKRLKLIWRTTLLNTQPILNLKRSSIDDIN
jgi:hypothetical protein